jgi:hypothetical protein
MAQVDDLMIGFLDREEKLWRLTLDPAAPDGEARAASDKLIASLRSRGYTASTAEAERPGDNNAGALLDVYRRENARLERELATRQIPVIIRPTKWMAFWNAVTWVATGAFIWWFLTSGPALPTVDQGGALWIAGMYFAVALARGCVLSAAEYAGRTWGPKP